MSEPLLRRLGRIVSARVGDAVDRLEKEQAAIIARRELTAQQQQKLQEKAQSLTGRASSALNLGHEPLAEAALHQQIDLERQGEALDTVLRQTLEDEARLSGEIAGLKARKAVMQEELQAYLTARLDLAMAGKGKKAER